MLAGVCAWVLALPVFPSQDGSAHKYYAWVIAQLLHGGSSLSASYSIRHPLPPYGSQDFFLVFLSHHMTMDMADKLFVCLIVIATAIAVRVCCGVIGPGGRWASLFVFPLLLHWNLLMGFMNYSLGLAIFLLIYACWIRGTEGRRWAWVGFVLLVALITVTHPVPLLLALALCCYDLLTQAVDRRRRGEQLPMGGWAVRLTGIAVLLVALGFPLMSADAKRTDSNLLHTMFRFRAYLTDLTLHGVSPYARHAHAPLILLYKLLLYAILLGAGFAAARGLRHRWRDHSFGRADWLLIAAVLLYLAIPLLPEVLNGSDYFATRLLLVVWLLVLPAAGRVAPALAHRRRLGLAAVCAALFTLLTATLYIRPAAQQVAAVEKLPLPAGTHGLILAGATDNPVEAQLGFDPLFWAPMLPMMHHGDVLVNSPWLDLKVYPLEPAADARLMINMLPTVRGKQAIDLHDGSIAFLPVAYQDKVLDAADFLMVEGWQPGGTGGAIESLSAAQSMNFHCRAEAEIAICRRAGKGF